MMTVHTDILQGAAELSESRGSYAMTPMRPWLSPTGVGFDYESLPAELADDARHTAERIRGRLWASVVDTGKDLIKIKACLEHGQFLRWIETECFLKERTAQRFMAAAHWARGKPDAVTGLPPAILYLLSAPSCPQSIQIEVVEQIGAGQTIDPTAVETKVHEAREEQKRAEKEAQQQKQRVKESPEQRRLRETREKHEQKREARWEADRQAQQQKRQKQQAAINEVVDFLVKSGVDLAWLISRLDEHEISVCDFIHAVKDRVNRSRSVTDDIPAEHADAASRVIH